MAQALAPRIRVNAIGPGPTLPSTRQDAAGFRRAGRRAAPEARAGACRIRRDDPLSMGGALGDRPDDRARRRPASCVANAGCDRHGGMSSRTKRHSRDMPRTAEAADDIAGFIARRRGRRRRCGRRRAGASAAPASTCRSRRSTGRAHAGDADGKVGAEVIQTLVKRLPNAPGVYRMMNAAGDVLYVGKARSLKKRVTNYAQGRFHTNRIGRMVRETATMEFVVTRTEIEALLLEANLIKRLAAALQRADAGRQVVSLYRAHRRPSVARHLQASRRALAQGRLFRAVRLGRRGRPHHQLAAAGVPAPHLHGLGLREPHAAVPALPDQALLRPVHRRDLGAGLCRARRGGEGFPVRPQPEGEDRDFGADAAGGRRPRFRARRRLPRPAGGAVACPEPPGHQPARRRGGRRLRHPPGRRAGLHPGVLLPHRPELGQPRLFPEGRSGAGGRRRCWLPSSPSSTTTSRARARSCCRTRSRSRSCWQQALATKRRPQGRDPGSAARREEGSGRPRACRTRARRSAAGWRKPRRRRGCLPVSPRLSGSTSRRAASRSTTTRTSWAPMPSAR